MERYVAEREVKELDAPELRLRWTVDGRNRPHWDDPIYSPPRRWRGGQWSLYFFYWQGSNSKSKQCLGLRSVSELRPDPFDVSVQLVRDGTERIGTEKSQERRCTYASRLVGNEAKGYRWRIWQTSDCHGGNLRFLVVIRKAPPTVDVISSTNQTANFFRWTLEDRRFIDGRYQIYAASTAAQNECNTSVADRPSFSRDVIASTNQAEDFRGSLSAASTSHPRTASTSHPRTASTSHPRTASTSHPRTASTAVQTECHFESPAQDLVKMPVQTQCHLESLAQDLGKMFDHRSDTDMEFHCGGETFRAHGALVSARSEVIASMLKEAPSDLPSDLLEEARWIKVVTISNMEPDVFRHFLRYLYTGTVPELTLDLALILYLTGVQYAVPGLAGGCGDYLMRHMTVQKSYDALICADAGGHSELREAVVDFMVVNDVPRTSDRWKDFCRLYPLLSVEVMNRLLHT